MFSGRSNIENLLKQINDLDVNSDNLTDSDFIGLAKQLIELLDQPNSPPIKKSFLKLGKKYNEYLQHKNITSICIIDPFHVILLPQGDPYSYTLASDFDVNKTIKKSGNTALHLAAKLGRTDFAELLLDKGADINAADQHDATSLHVATQYGHLDFAQLLLDRGADIKAAAQYGYTPLHWAAIYERTDLAQLLLDKGTDINTATQHDVTPLHAATQYGRLGAVQLLLDKGANISAAAKSGFTPLHVAAQYGHPGVARLLLDRGADINAIDYDDGETPVHTAIKYGHLHIVQFFIEQGINKDIFTSYGATPLHLAARYGKLHIAEFLIKNGADINAADEFDGTPLHEAVRAGHFLVAQLLIKKGADINALDENDNTVLYTAVKSHQSNMAIMLYENRAELDSVDLEPLNVEGCKTLMICYLLDKRLTGLRSKFLDLVTRLGPNRVEHSLRPVIEAFERTLANTFDAFSAYTKLFTQQDADLRSLFFVPTDIWRKIAHERFQQELNIECSFEKFNDLLTDTTSFNQRLSNITTFFDFRPQDKSPLKRPRPDRDSQDKTESEHVSKKARFK